MNNISLGILTFLAISVASAQAADSVKPALANTAIADAASGDGATAAQSDDSQPALASGVPKRLSPLAGTDAEAWASVPRWSHARPAAHAKARRSGL